MAALLAQEFVKIGESVTIVTDVEADRTQDASFPFPIWRRPSPGKWIELLRGHDLLVHFNISLKALWPLLFVRRPFVAVHHGYYIMDRAGRRDWRERLKLWVARRATNNIAVSQAIARTLEIPCVVIPNPYDPRRFFRRDGVRREQLIFVGRLVSDKGADVLLHALAILRDRGLQPNLLVVGDGPERASLENLSGTLKLKEQVKFTGSKTQREVANLLRVHKILVIPSLIPEGFGLVAIEAVACGCIVIGPDTGGVPEAIGGCGVTFRTGDRAALANRIEELLTSERLVTELLAPADENLGQHHPAPVAARYAEVMRQAVCQN